MALNRLNRLQPHDAWIIAPLHDAIVFEAPLEAFEKVTKKELRRTLYAGRDHFEKFSEILKLIQRAQNRDIYPHQTA